MKDYANDFLAFLDNGNHLFPLAVQDMYLDNAIGSYFSLIKKQILDEYNSRIKKNDIVTNNEIKQIIFELIEKHYNAWENANNIKSIPIDYPKKNTKKYDKIINKIIKKVFKELPLSRYQHNHLKKIASNLFSKFPKEIKKTDISGIVIVGFGDKDTFPALESFHIEGITNDRLKYIQTVSIQIDIKNSAAVVPFAQSEMVTTFMEGVYPGCREFHESYMSKLFEEYPKIIVDNITKYNNVEKYQLLEKLNKINVKVLEDFRKDIDNFIKKEYVDPITSVVEYLPKDELAAMAESLVNLTSFKRKVTMVTETVGGPIDVAVISKGDGFIWMKRKHYFKAELNPQFFENYYKEVENGRKYK